MMDKPLISVVVPVYKAEVWLRDCVDSILAQTLSDIEVLLVDDGSPDNCEAICDEYAGKDGRVRVFHKENGGVSMARKTGVDNATADYISFVDADDTLPPTALADLYRGGGGGSDIIIGSCSDKSYDREYLSPQEYRSITMTKKLGNTFVLNTPWGRLIARHLFNKNTFTSREIVHSEDALMNVRLAFVNKKPVRLVSKKVYNYNSHEDSTCHTFVHTMEYEILYYKHFVESIPAGQRELYAKESVIARLQRLWDIYIYSQHRNVWYGTEYYKDLMTCVKRCGLQIPLTHRIKLRMTNAKLLRYYILSENCLTYRYGLLKKKLTSWSHGYSSTYITACASEMGAS